MILKKSYYLFSKLSLFIYVITILTLSFQTQYSDISQLFGVMLAIIFLLESLAEKNFRFIFPYPLFFALFFLFILIFSSLITSSGYTTLLTITQLIILSAIIINIVGLTNRVWPVLLGILVGTLLLNYRVWDFLGNTFYSKGGRLSSDLINSNLYSMYLCISVLVSIYFIFMINRRTMKSFLKKLIITTLISIIIFHSYLIITLGGSRKGIIAIFLIALALGFYFWKRTNPLFKVAYLLILPLLCIFILNSMENTIGYQRLTHADNSISQRAVMLSTGLELWSEKPVFGWGTSQFGNISGYGTYSHNNYVELLANNGLIGFISYYLIFVSIFHSIFKLVKHKVFRYDKFILFWCILTLFILLFWDIGRVSYYSKITWLIISIVISLIYVKKKDAIANLQRIKE